jgi:lipopolysaccharide biosynthesis glycosyltransferase
MQYFDKRYNVEKRMLYSKNYKKIYDEKIILHFVASKPWDKIKENKNEETFGKAEDIWWKYYNMEL